MAKQAKLTLLIDLADKLSGKLGGLENKLTKFQSKWQGKLNGLTDKFANKLGMSGENLKRGLMVSVMAVITAIGVLSTKGVQAAERFDAAFLPIKQLNLDKSAGALDNYRNKIRDAAYDVGTNIVDSTNAIYDLQSATGLYGDDAIAVFKKVGQYSIATGANVNDAMNSTTKAMKAFGLGVKDIDGLLASNAKTVQTGITTFDRLAKVQTMFGGAAKTAGQDVDAANKLFAMFTSIAPDDNQAATMTKGFFDGLRQNADKIEKELKIDVFDKNGQMRKADELMKDIAHKFQGLTDKEISGMINTIGGPEGLQNALGKAAKGAEDMIATFDAFDSSAFSMADAIKNAEGDFATMKKVFFDRIEILMTKFGEKIMPQIAQLFDVLTPVLNWLYQNIDWLLPVMGTFIGLLGLATAAVWLLNSALFANPIVWIIALIGGLIALIVVAIQKFDEWGAAVLALMGPFGMLIGIIKNLYDHWDSVKQAFKSGGIKAALWEINKVIIDALLKPVQQLLGWIGELTGWEWAKKAANDVSMFRSGMGTQGNLKVDIPELAWTNKSKEDEKTDLYATTRTGTGSGAGKSKSNPLKETVNKVTGDAKATKNISIKLEALHKGDVVINGGSTRGMTPQQLEDWFNEMMMRIIRNAELS